MKKINKKPDDEPDSPDTHLENEDVGPKIAATPGLISSHSSLLALKLSSCGYLIRMDKV